MEFHYVQQILRDLWQLLLRTSNKIFMVPAFDAMELANALLFDIAWEVKFRANKAKDQIRLNLFMKALSSEVDQVTKENQRLTKVLEESEQ